MDFSVEDIKEVGGMEPFNPFWAKNNIPSPSSNNKIFSERKEIRISSETANNCIILWTVWHLIFPASWSFFREVFDISIPLCNNDW